MKSIEFMDYFGEIDDSIIQEAETEVILSQKTKAFTRRNISLIAASLVLVLALSYALVNFLNLKEDMGNSLMGQRFATIEEIPVTEIGNDYGFGCSSKGPVDLFTSQGNFYFTKVTRWVGDDDLQDTVRYYTLFRYDPESGYSTAISDEVGYIYYLDGQFIYNRSNVNISSVNKWDYPYYSNNSQWNDEKIINTSEVEKLLNFKKGDAVVERLGNEISGKELRVTMEDDGREYIITPDLSVMETFDVIGVMEDKIYLSGYTGDENALYSMDLTGTNLTRLMIKDEAVLGINAYIGQDGMIYANNSDDSSSKLIRIDPRSNRTEVILEVDDFVWQYALNDKYLVSIVAGDNPYGPAKIKAFNLK